MPVNCWSSSLAGERHYQLFQGSVAGPFADAVDAAFDLSRAGPDGRQAVGDRQPQVVVAVHRKRRILDVAHVLADVGDHHPELIGLGEAARVGDIDRRRASVDHRFEDLTHV